eukprot:CAMPEP_0115849780 /NCGR_PEP_ID=MMETSP0287-20121206/11627_1 /TAXON_ID=412157 /ORGANISM="Chrysochromulina rotalis, Strain UIO044" /LENGTH=344 /DNA_ID=CAMNT_0003303761 /DNA_START=212 /DNA_END=1246 /DNA_ORIENTATION=+
MVGALCTVALIEGQAHDELAWLPRRLQGINVYMSPSTRASLVTSLLRAWDDQDQATSNKSWEALKKVPSLPNAMQVSTNDRRNVSVLSGPKGSSPGRIMIERFIEEAATMHARQRQKHQVCLDWSKRYVAHFNHCREIYNYAYAPHKLRLTKTTWGLRKAIGDLGNVSLSSIAPTFDLAIVTQVFEHVPHFWRAIRGLHAIMKPGGVVLFSVPFAYIYHPFPGDFWRYSPMGILHLFESHDFDVCNFMSFGFRAVQMHALGLNFDDVPLRYITETRSEFSLLKWSTDYAMVAQRSRKKKGVVEKGRGGAQTTCNLPKTTYTNEVALEKWRAFADGYWPDPTMPD